MEKVIKTEPGTDSVRASRFFYFPPHFFANTTKKLFLFTFNRTCFSPSSVHLFYGWVLHRGWGTRRSCILMFRRHIAIQYVWAACQRGGPSQGVAVLMRNMFQSDLKRHQGGKHWNIFMLFGFYCSLAGRVVCDCRGQSWCSTSQSHSSELGLDRFNKTN